MGRYIVAFVFIALAWVAVALKRLPWWAALVLTVVVVALLVGLYVYREYRRRASAREIERALQAHAEEHIRSARPDRQDEIRALQSEFTTAVASLKSSSLGRSGIEALYALPWYVIIGPPGAGKTTALKNSGLDFPYQASGGGGLRGVGGTRNCEWWLTNDAVLLDTAGRYTTEDEDRDEWLAFLDLLKKHRPRKPLNGVMVAVGIDELGDADEETVVALGKKVRERVDEVLTRLGVLLPVYVLFTKCDLVPGFVETFSGLPKAERGQIWGFTLPEAGTTQPPEEAFSGAFTELLEVVERRAWPRLGEVRKREMREVIYTFPQQMEVMRGAMGSFIRTLFAKNVYQGTPQLRGVYLTSGTQEGRVIDRVMQRMADAFGVPDARAALPPTQTEARSYFLRDVFAKVIFPDQDVAVRSPDEERRERNRRYLIAASVFGFAAIVSALPTLAYFENRKMLRETRATVEEIAAHRALADGTLLPWNTLSALHSRVLDLRSRSRLTWQWGMYRGNRLRDPLTHLFAAEMRRNVGEPVVRLQQRELNSFAQQFLPTTNAPPVDSQGPRIETLRAYLLLTAPAEPAQPSLSEREQRWVGDHLVASWEQAVVGAQDPQFRALRQGTVGLYTQLLASGETQAMPRQLGIVRDVRSVLNRTPAADLSLERIKRAIDPEGFGIGLSDVVGPAVTVLRSRARVHGAFTRQAWDTRIPALMEAELASANAEAWVLGVRGAELDREARKARLRSRYFSAYIEEWRHFIDSILLVPPNNTPEHLHLLEELTAGTPTPYGALFAAVAYNTRLEEPDTQVVANTLGQQVVNAANRQAAAAGDAGVAIANALIGTRPQGPPLTNRQDVQAFFWGFARFGVRPPLPAGSPPPAPDSGGPALGVDTYRAQLEGVRDAMRTFVENPGSPSAPLVTAVNAARNTVQGMISNQDEVWRLRFHALLWMPVEWSTRETRTSMASGAGSRWCTAVVVPYERTLRHRYPFDPRGHDAALADVAQFYRPTTGTLWSFYNQSLQNDIPRSGERFTFAERFGNSLSEVYVPTLPDFFSASNDLSTVLFSPSSPDPRVDFEVRIRPSPGIATTTLEIDGQTVEYHNGPEQWSRLHWPGEGGAHGASLRAQGDYGVIETIRQDGEWGLFRLLEAGTVRGNPAARMFTVTWTLRDQGISLAMDLRPMRSENPIAGVPGRTRELSVMQPFRGPELRPQRLTRFGSDCDLREVPPAPGESPRHSLAPQIHTVAYSLRHPEALVAESLS